MAKFQLLKEQGKLTIIHNEYPKFKGNVTFGQLSDIENIEMIDNCTDPMIIARAMREAGEYILSQNKD
jgi:hypothetical protein